MFWKLRAALRIATERDRRQAEASYRVLTESDPARRLELWKEISEWMAPAVSREALDILTWTVTTEGERFEQLTRLSRSILPGYRFTWPWIDWWKDSEFNSYLSRFGELDGFNTHRRWVIYQLMRLTAGVVGDTVECGVYQGAGSYLMAMANRARGDGSLHHAFDSFEGLSTPTERDGNHWQAGALACDLNSVRSNLEEFGNEVRYYQGWIPSRFSEVADRCFRFVYLDLDLYEPTRDSLAFFYPRLRKGSVLACDDYLMGTCPGVKQAVDEFLADKPEKMLGMADGGGAFIKGVQVEEPALRSPAA
jgi:hypothetical protein